MGKSIVVLSGSPRKGANTDRLAAAFVEGAEAAGNRVSLFRVADMKIGGCLGCGRCFREAGVCVQKDDMLPILDALRKADVLVLATPVYYFGPTAQLKLAIDRTYALLKEGTPVKRAVFLITCGASPEAAKSTLSMFRQICEFQGVEEAGYIVAPGLHEPGQIEAYYELHQAREMGRGV